MSNSKLLINRFQPLFYRIFESPNLPEMGVGGSSSIHFLVYLNFLKIIIFDGHSAVLKVMYLKYSFSFGARKFHKNHE